VWQNRSFLLFTAQVIQDAVDGVLVFDAGDNPGSTSAPAADLDVYIEDALEPLRPSHYRVALGRCPDLSVVGGLWLFAAPCWSDQSSKAMVRGKDTVVAGEIDPGFWHQSRQAGHEIHRIERHMGRTVPVRRLQGIDDLAGRTER